MLWRTYTNNWGAKNRTERLVKKLSPYLRNVKSLLDVGSADGKIASRLVQENPNMIVECFDVVLQKEPSIPVKKYDGKSLPFKEGSFECVMLVDVLHHTDDPEILLKEAIRVSKKRILIKDHYYRSGLDVILLRILDYLGNKSFGIRLPYKYLRRSQWEGLFEKLGLKIEKEEKFTTVVKHVVYSLAVK